MDHSLIDSQIANLASSTHGFVGSDLAALCNEAALVCLRRHVVFKKSFDSSEVTSKSMQSKEPCLRDYGCADAIIGAPGPTNNILRMLSTDHVDPASSSLSVVTVSAETVESFGFSGTNQREYDSVQDTFRLTSDEVAPVVGEDTLLKVTFDDFEKAKMRVRPSAMREVSAPSQLFYFIWIRYSEKYDRIISILLIIQSMACSWKIKISQAFLESEPVK